MYKVVLSLQLFVPLQSVFECYCELMNYQKNNTKNARQFMGVIKIQKPSCCFCQEAFLVLVQVTKPLCTVLASCQWQVDKWTHFAVAWCTK